MNIGDQVKVKFHHSKPYESEKYVIKSIYLNDYICQPSNKPQVSCRSINKNMVALWD